MTKAERKRMHLEWLERWSEAHKSESQRVLERVARLPTPMSSGSASPPKFTPEPPEED